MYFPSPIFLSSCVLYKLLKLFFFTGYAFIYGFHVYSYILIFLLHSLLINLFIPLQSVYFIIAMVASFELTCSFSVLYCIYPMINKAN